MEKTKTKKRFTSFTIAFALVLTLFAYVPLPVIAQGDAFSTISAGLSHTMAIKNDGSLWL